MLATPITGMKKKPGRHSLTAEPTAAQSWFPDDPSPTIFSAHETMPAFFPAPDEPEEVLAVGKHRADVRPVEERPDDLPIDARHADNFGADSYYAIEDHPFPDGMLDDRPDNPFADQDIADPMTFEEQPAVTEPPRRNVNGRRRSEAPRRRAGAAHRGRTNPVGILTWSLLSVGLGLGVLMLGRSRAFPLQVGGFMLLLLLVPAALVVFVSAIRRGFGSGKAAATAGFFLTLAVLRLSYFF
jgi:hypothetical protein